MKIIELFLLSGHFNITCQFLPSAVGSKGVELPVLGKMRFRNAFLKVQEVSVWPHDCYDKIFISMEESIHPLINMTPI